MVVLLTISCLLSSCSNAPGKIREVNISPSGNYQIDEIDWSGGATSGESYLLIETSDSVTAFSSAGDTEPQNGYSLRDNTLTNYRTDYIVDWESDELCYVRWSRGSGQQSNYIGLARIELDEGDWNCQSGTVRVDMDRSIFYDFSVSGGNVYLNCRLYIENTFDEQVAVSISGYSQEDNAQQAVSSGLLADGNIIAVDDNGQESAVVIEANWTGYVDVVFCGEQGSSEMKTDRNVPDCIYLDLA